MRTVHEMGGGNQPAFVVLDGVSWRSSYAPALSPFEPLVADVRPWPVRDASGRCGPLLDWLAARDAGRPVLGLTAHPLFDETGYPVRGASLLAGGVALVSSADLGDGVLAGVIRHEVAHALGLPHCDDPACALSERPHPLDPADRPSSLCEACEDLWHHAALRCGA